MKIIQEYIKELLFEQDCVVIPDFGGFVANYHQSKLTQEMAHPARKWFAFNELLRTDDGLLLTYIIHKEQLSTLEASKKIKTFVAYVRQKMREDDYFYLKGVGSFCYNEENKTQFIPVYNANFSTNNFGLSSFNITKIDYSETVKKPNVTISTVPIVNSTTSPNNQSILIESPFIISHNHQKKHLVEYYLVASMVAIVALFLSFYLYDNKQFTLGNLNVFTSIKNNVYTSSVSDTQPLENKQVNILDNARIINQSRQHQSTYFVIVGSFEHKKNAIQLMGTLKKEGYSDAKLISNDKGEKIKVSLTDFATKEAAIKKASSLEKAWIYTSELLP